MISYVCRYENCLQCSQDPGCGWDRETGQCGQYAPGTLINHNKQNDAVCDSSIFKRYAGLAACTDCTDLYCQYIQNVLIKKSVLICTASIFNVY